MCKRIDAAPNRSLSGLGWACPGFPPVISSSGGFRVKQRRFPCPTTARLVTAPGTYEQGMLIDQLGNIMRAEGGADQKIGSESRRRLDDLLAEMKAIEGELRAIAR